MDGVPDGKKKKKKKIYTRIYPSHNSSSFLSAIQAVFQPFSHVLSRFARILLPKLHSKAKMQSNASSKCKFLLFFKGLRRKKTQFP